MRFYPYSTYVFCFVMLLSITNHYKTAHSNEMPSSILPPITSIHPDTGYIPPEKEEYSENGTHVEEVQMSIPITITYEDFYSNLHQYINTCWIKDDTSYKVTLSTNSVTIKSHDLRNVFLDIHTKETKKSNLIIVVSGILIHQSSAMLQNIVKGIHRSAMDITLCTNT